MGLKSLYSKKRDSKKRDNDKDHNWETYVNPRNQVVKIKACSKCGVIRGMVDDQSLCKDTKRVANGFGKQGWIIAASSIT